MKPKNSFRWLFIVSLAIMIPFAAPYFTFDPTKSRTVITSSEIQYPTLVAHIFFALVAMVAGFLQFLERFRKLRPRAHRIVGRIYVGSVWISGCLAIVVSLYVDNFAKAVSFLALSLLWLFTSWKGYHAAVMREYESHRQWMIRSFGITLVAVSGRLAVPVLLLAYAALHGFSLPGGRELMVEEVLNVNIWVGLVANLAIVEWVILKPKNRNHREDHSHGK